jgi:hypothetical protein
MALLLVVKPNICHGLPVDLINFKAKHPEFPQQTTVDQFFSEAQWESYHQLGRYLGGRLSEAFIHELLANSQWWFAEEDCSPFERSQAVAKAAAAVVAPNAQAQPKAPAAGAATAAAAAAVDAADKEAKAQDLAARLPARIAATAVGATLSLGAAATVGVAAWQAIDSARASYAKQVNAERDALKDLADKWSRITPAGLEPDKPAERAKTVSALAAALLHSADTLCPVKGAGWFQSSALALNIVNDGVRECAQLLNQWPENDACKSLVAAANTKREPSIPWCLLPSSLATVDRMGPPMYWGYGYTLRARTLSLHPCDPVLRERQAADPGSAPLGNFTCTNGGEPYPLVVEVDRPAAAALPPPPAPPPPGPSPAPPWPTPAPPPPTTAAAPAPAAAAPAPAADSTACAGKTVYIQIYGPEQRDRVRDLFRKSWQAQGASVPPIEDVWASARSNGRSPPVPVSATTVRMHDPDSAKCVSAMLTAVGPSTSTWKVEPLSSRLRPTRGVIEVWVPPSPQQAQAAPRQ